MTNEKAEILFEQGLEHYNTPQLKQAIKTWKKIPLSNNLFYKAQYYIGLAYVYDIPPNYKLAIDIWEKIPDIDENYSEAQWNIGVAHIQLENVDEAVKSFTNAKSDIFDMLQVLRNPPKREIITKVISDILDIEENSFFNLTTNKKNQNQELYKKIFIQSLEIISLLHVNAEAEKQVAHYTRKWVAEKILFTKSKLRLNSIIEANDPKEGITLLDFLGIENKAQTQTPYQTFITCFTFNTESLNQFRLYGKEENREATGVSILVNDTLFSDRAKLSIAQEKDYRNKLNAFQIEKSKKTALYRCIYIDPKTRRVISIGHKEDYSFYRENMNRREIEKEYNLQKYKEYIENILKEIRTKMDKLSCFIRNNDQLDRTIISELLLPLRHLTKHIAFKEEQECRIFAIENLSTSEIIVPIRASTHSAFSNMYIEYNIGITDHTKKIIFAPMTEGFEQFEAFTKYQGHNFPCERCDHPFSIKAL